MAARQLREEVASLDLDALIRSLTYGEEARRLFPDLPDPDAKRYPATIHPTDPKDSTWRQSFKVWGCDLRDKSNPYWPYGHPVASAVHAHMAGYSTQSNATGTILLDVRGQAVHCTDCGGTTHWKRGDGEKSHLWYCKHCL